MTTGELVDVYLKHHANAGSTDHQNSTLRQRTTEAVQETVDEVWDESDWDNKQVTTTGSLTSGTDSADAPSDFISFGEAGGLFITVGGQVHKLDYLDPASLFEAREENRNSSGVPEFYTVAQQDSSYNVQIIFDRPADTTYSLRFYYDSTPPVILDRPLAPTLAAGGTSGQDPNGTYFYRVVFIGTDGSQSEAGVTATVTVTDDLINVTNIPLGSSAVVARWLYRTVGDDTVDGTYKLLAILTDNTTTTFEDIYGDGALGDAMTATTTASSLKRVPESYHRSVLLKGVKAKRSRDMGSGLAGEQEADYRRELGRMKARRKHGLEDLQRIGDGGLPSFRMH